MSRPQLDAESSSPSVSRLNTSFRSSVSHILKSRASSPKSSSIKISPPSEASQPAVDATLAHPAEKATPFERFLKLARKRTDGTIDFSSVRSQPIDDHAQGEPNVVGVDNETVTAGAISPSFDVITPDAGVVETEDAHAHTTDVVHDSTEQGSDSEIVPEPSSLARRIQMLLSSLPSYVPSSSRISSSENVAHSTEASDDARPMLPAFISDSKLISLLSSPSIMNGSVSRGRQSVWSLLDGLKSSAGHDEEAGSEGGENRSTEVGTEIVDDDSSSFMLYAPLEPDDSSQVEIARSDVISMDEDASISELSERQPEGRSQSRLGNMWPFNMGVEKPSVTKKPTERKVWVPSSTKISLEVRWWGYRVYLPPPVLAILDNQRIETSKRAALLTTALKWLLDHIPIAAVPPQVRPVLQLLRTLVPYLAYLGAFVAWSWGAIKGFDKGRGVILTATWLLPLALIPGSWDDLDAPAAPSLAIS